MSIPQSFAFAALVFLFIFVHSSQGSNIRYVKCPSTPLLRHAGTRATRDQQLNPEEQNYLRDRRRKVVAPAYQAYLDHVLRSLASSTASGPKQTKTLPDYVKRILTSKDPNALPHTAFAASGGGYRATIYSSGILNAFDGRNPSSNRVGTGGLLQAADYLAGLSGGSWMVTALAQADFPTFQELVLTGAKKAAGKNGVYGGLLLQYDLFSPQSNTTGMGTSRAREVNLEYTLDIIRKMSDKVRAGFHVTMADFWSLVLRYHIVGGTTKANFFDKSVPHGLDINFSGIRHLPTYKQYQQPFPIITGLAISPGQDNTKVQPQALVPLTNNAYEFTPVETGSWDPNLASFLPTEFLGTRLRSGKPDKPTACVQNFDQASYLAAISSDVFPQTNTSTADFFTKSSVHEIVSLINATFSSSQPGISIDTASVPNPFFGSGSSAYLDKASKDLRLLDGGLDGAVTPYLPLLIPARKVDIIIGIDAISLVNDGKDGPNYATGASLKATFARAKLSGGAYNFPNVPDNDAIYGKLRAHPTFFGCQDASSPLIVWLPNSAPLDGSKGVTNTSINQIQYEPSQVQSMFVASSEIAYRGFPTPQEIKSKKFRDPLWSACLACAVVDRSREREKIERQGICSDCFERYCWKA